MVFSEIQNNHYFLDKKILNLLCICKIKLGMDNFQILAIRIFNIVKEMWCFIGAVFTCLVLFQDNHTEDEDVEVDEEPRAHQQQPQHEEQQPEEHQPVFNVNGTH
jgi:hypothetical protein